MSLPECSVWDQIIKRTKAPKERQLVEELQQAATLLQTHIETFDQSKALLEQYEAVWRQLLVCRRSDLMCCIPLTSQRISQLVTVVSTTAAAAQAAMLPIQRLLRTLGAYAAVNKSTAEELQQTPETASMAADKLQLSVLEEQLIIALQRLIATSWHHTSQKQQPSQQRQESVSVAPAARKFSAEPANSLGGGASPAALSAGLQAVNPASEPAPAVGDDQGCGAGVAASGSSLQQTLQQDPPPQQQQLPLLQGEQHQPHHQQQHSQQQTTLQQQQHVLQQRQQQLELQLQQMGQLLQQQQRHGEKPQQSSTNADGNADPQDHLHRPQPRGCCQAQLMMTASPSGRDHQQGQQQHPLFLQLPLQQPGGNSSACAPVAAAGTAGLPTRPGHVQAAEAVGRILQGSAATAAVSVDGLDTGMIGSSLPSQEPHPSAAAVDTRPTAAEAFPKGASSSGQLPSFAGQHFAVCVQGTHAPAATSTLTAQAPGNRLLAGTMGLSSEAADAGPHTQAGPWDGLTY